jgi:hypothetical protein
MRDATSPHSVSRSDLSISDRCSVPSRAGHMVVCMECAESCDACPIPHCSEKVENCMKINEGDTRAA